MIGYKDRRRYSGPTGWILAYHREDKAWKITSPMRKDFKN